MAGALNPLSSLTKDLLLEIFRYFSIQELSITNLVCKQFYELSSHPALWEKFAKDLREKEIHVQQGEESLKAAFIRFTKEYCTYFIKHFPQIDKKKKHFYDQKLQIDSYIKNISREKFQQLFLQSSTEEKPLKMWQILKAANFTPGILDFNEALRKPLDKAQMQFFLNCGIKPNLFSLEAALEARSSKDIIECLLERGCKTSIGALNIALKYGNSEEIILLLLKKETPNNYSLQIAQENNYSKALIEQIQQHKKF
ncbi:MAG: hypothetical protein Tsb0015_12080 [Simkaniaceae bacterium]